MSASNVTECEQACCNSGSCEVYQWCASSSCTPLNSCWIGSRSNCQKQDGWVSKGRDAPSPNSTCSVPYCQPGFDDSSWRGLSIPHDFVVEGDFDKNADMAHGYLPYGTGWYRKHFTPPASLQGQTIWLDFDGAMVITQVWLNGIYLGGHQSGYTPFRFYLNESVLVLGKENVLAVRVDGHDPSSSAWWYDGGGLYRHSKLFVLCCVVCLFDYFCFFFFLKISRCFRLQVSTSSCSFCFVFCSILVLIHKPTHAHTYTHEPAHVYDVFKIMLLPHLTSPHSLQPP